MYNYCALQTYTASLHLSNTVCVTVLPFSNIADPMSDKSLTLEIKKKLNKTGQDIFVLLELTLV